MGTDEGPLRRFRLPESFAQSGDPVDGNPFRDDDPRHDVWRGATQRAEEEVCRINVNAHSALTLDNAHVWQTELSVAKFDTWAKRGVQVIWSDDAVQLYDRWLLAYANSWIEALSQQFASDPPPWSADSNLHYLRDQLGARVQFWKAEARAYRSAQEETLLTAEDAPPTVRPGVVRRRRLAVQKHRKTHDLTGVAFARKVGISEAAIRGIVREDRTRFALPTQDRLLKALGMTRADWYRE